MLKLYNFEIWNNITVDIYKCFVFRFENTGFYHKRNARIMFPSFCFGRDFKTYN